ncbi:MAG: ADP-glyceromanno-heptose 6-epimerase [Proteobacteria bacterium]|nr:ADP-glyceromanno-heptose 6-epimerase [Pseudomonadota bacterium]
MFIITGGAGFIGSNLAAALEKAGLGPLVICDWTGDAEKMLNLAKRKLEKRITPEELPAFLKAQGKRVNAVFHMGAISSTTETDVAKITTYNVDFTTNLLLWCADNGKRMIYASSAATYGNGEHGFDDREDLEYLKKLHPMNLYGWSKNVVDQYLVDHHGKGKKSPPQWVGLKFFNVYGPNEYHKEGQRSVAHQIYPFAARDEAFALFKSRNPAYPDGGQKRDFVWVGDCCSVMLWLYKHPEVSGLFNVGSGKARSFLDLASAVYRAAGREPKITYRDMPENIRTHYQYFTEASMEKLRNAGYTAPLTSLEDGINSYIKDYLAKDDPYC